VKGFKGVVTDIGLKTTKIRNWKGEIKIYNNGDIGDITNFSLNPSIAVVEFGIAYEEDVQKTTEILTIELPKVRNLFEQIIEDPVVVGVTEIANSSVNIRVIAKTLNEQHYAVERGIRKFIKEILDSNEIKFAFPQIVVHNAQSKKDN
jgi:small conductance mechanosensitive channel